MGSDILLQKHNLIKTEMGKKQNPRPTNASVIGSRFAGIVVAWTVLQACVGTGLIFHLRRQREKFLLFQVKSNGERRCFQFGHQQHLPSHLFLKPRGHQHVVHGENIKLLVR